MAVPVTVKGMILTATPIGEFDKRLVMLTREKGKITAFAKGARRQNNPLMAAANPFAFGDFTLYEGRTSYSMVQANISNYFMELAADYEKACYGFYFMELAEYYTRENNDEVQMLKLLYQSLRALISDVLDNRLIRCIFESRSLVISGEYPNVFQCGCCGEAATEGFFSLKAGGFVCDRCHPGNGADFKIMKSTLYTLQFIVSAPVEKLYTFKVADDVLTELRMVLNRWMAVYIDKKMKSLDVLSEIL